MRVTSAWFVSKTFDFSFFFLPIWIVWLVVPFLPESLVQADLPLAVWVCFVLLVDVAHVWASIYRTYWDPITQAAWPRLLKIVPVVCFTGCWLLTSVSESLLWRVLAYVAVFHFIKQQIGIAALYRARYHQVESKPMGSGWAKLEKKLDNMVIYLGTLGPVLYWHWHLPRHFDWFVAGDFIDPHRLVAGLPPGLIQMLSYLLVGCWLLGPLIWLVAHGIAATRGHKPPYGKMLWIATTYLNWYLGIVYFNSDLVFTISNVIAHGVPYMGLIALHQYRTGPLKQLKLVWLGPAARVLLMALPVLAFAYFEEYLWDLWAYREHAAFFSPALPYSEEILDESFWRALAIAFLCMPQTTHYVLDGFIWRLNGQNPQLKEVLFSDR